MTEPIFDIQALLDANDPADTMTGIVWHNEERTVGHYVTHGDFTPHTIDLRHQLDRIPAAPSRPTGRFVHRSLASLITWTDMHATGQTAVYADPDNLTVTSVIDGHDPGEGGPGWHDFTGSCKVRHTESFQRWQSVNDRALTQDQFIDLLGDGLTEIATPDAASLRDMATQLTRIDNATVESNKPVNGRHQITIRQESGVESRDAKGNVVAIPERLTLMLVVFDGQEPRQVNARLKVAARGQLAITVHLVDLAVAVREAFVDLVTGCASSEAGGPVRDYPVFWATAPNAPAHNL